MPVFTNQNLQIIIHPWKINMEHNKRGLEDAFPFPNRWLSGGVTSPSQLRWFVKLPNCCAGFDDSLSNHHWHLHHFHFSLDIMAGHLGLVLAFDKLAKVSWLKRDLRIALSQLGLSYRYFATLLESWEPSMDSATLSIKHEGRLASPVSGNNS